MTKPLFNSLNKKMIAFLIMAVGACLGITNFLSIRMERMCILQSAQEKVESFAEVVQTNILRAMEGQRSKDIPVIIQRLSSQTEFMMVRVFDKRGRIIESSKEGERGNILNIPDASRLEKDVILTHSHRGEKVLSLLRPFHNEDKCTRCHGSLKEVLAYLNVDFSLDSVETRLKSYQNMQILSAFSVLLMMSGAMFFFFSRSINRPIHDVIKKMSEVEKGDFNVQIPVKAKDELGHLADSFNYMVKNLQEMRRKEEEQRVVLERVNENLHEKIGRLNILYESSKAINQSLKIEEILRMTIENVTKSMEFDRVVLTIVDEKKGALIGKWSIGIDEEIVRRVQIPQEELKGILSETFLRREPILVKDTSSLPIIEKRKVKRCWEVLNCKVVDCPVFLAKELRCWMLKGTHCHLEMKQDSFTEKIRVCGRCSYFNQEIIKRSDIVNLLLFGSHSFISVPLIARDSVKGVMLADRMHSEREITDGDIKLLMTFLSHVSVAVENAMLYEKLERKVDLGQRQLQETNTQLGQKLSELNEMRSFNESILQNLYGGVVTYNQEGIITFMNQPGAQLLGWSEQDVVGRSIQEVLCEECLNPSLFNGCLEEGGGGRGETEIRKKGGQKIPVEVFLSPLKDKEGRVTGVTGIFRDITEQKEIETRMHRMDKLASLGQLASGIAHEIKNPLTGIGSAIQVLSSSIPLDRSKKEMMKEILEQINRLDRTIKNMLSFAKPGHPNKVLADPREIIQDALFLVSQRLKNQHIEVHLDFIGDSIKVMMDPQLIQHAILNVVLNAVEAMPSGGHLTLSLKEEQTSDPRGNGSTSCMSLTISDTGPGIPDDVLPQIFNPFFTTKTIGTGLGLSITQRIIEQHDGRIDIQSEAGKGASFTISLPM